jgi:hypothetical protein
MHMKVKLIIFFMNLFLKFPLQGEVLSSKLLEESRKAFQ